MSLNPPQTVYPYLSYADAPAAIDFLCSAFGFEERFRFPMDDGRLGHAELELEGGVLMLASVWEEMGFASPQDLPGNHGQIYWMVEDVDAHFERAKAAGATIAAEPIEEPHGARIYKMRDADRWADKTKMGGWARYFRRISGPEMDRVSLQLESNPAGNMIYIRLWQGGGEFDTERI